MFVCAGQVQRWGHDRSQIPRPPLVERLAKWDFLTPAGGTEWFGQSTNAPYNTDLFPTLLGFISEAVAFPRMPGQSGKSRIEKIRDFPTLSAGLADQPLCRERHSVLLSTQWRNDPNRLIWSDSDHLASFGETTPSY